MGPTDVGPAAGCGCEHGFSGGTEDHGQPTGEESFAPVLYCGQESLLFIPVQNSTLWTFQA